MAFQEQALKQDISINSVGDNIVITIGSGEMPSSWENSAVYVVIDHINLIPNAAVTMQLKNGATSDANNATVAQTNYGGAYSLTANQGFVLENSARDEHGIITLKANKSFVINLSGAVQVSGFIRYRLLATN